MPVLLPTSKSVVSNRMAPSVAHRPAVRSVLGALCHAPCRMHRTADQTARPSSPNTVRRGIRRARNGRSHMRSSPNRLVATIFGAVYILVGLLGFAVTGGVE